MRKMILEIFWIFFFFARLWLSKLRRDVAVVLFLTQYSTCYFVHNTVFFLPECWPAL